MKRLIILIILYAGTCISVFSQEERKIIREGNELYKEKEYNKAESEFRKALEINPSEEKLNNNIGASKYRNNSFKDAVSSYENILNNSTDSKEKADAYYNIGNSYLQAGEYDKSIESYRNALRQDPNHDLSRYNMAVATKVKMQNQSQNSQNKNENGDGEGHDQQQNQDQEQDENKDKDQDKGEGEEQDKQENDDNKNNEDKPEPKDHEMTKEEMERFLESLQEKEKEVQDKVNKEKFKSQQRIVEKEW